MDATASRPPNRRYSKLHFILESTLFYRGQDANYDSMRPSIFRKRRDGSGRFFEVSLEKKQRAISSFISNHVDDFKKLAIPEHAIEPTLQHYGFVTRWIDLVDNLWVGLWFGLHSEHRRINNINFAYVEQRRDNGSQYLFVIGTDAKTPKNGKHGLFKGKNTHLIDLRKACPSQFIRPHAQHGLLMRRADYGNNTHKEMAEFVTCIIELPCEKVRNWIGGSELLSANYIYPSPYHDHGYSDLLNYLKTTKQEMHDIGSITLVSY